MSEAVDLSTPVLYRIEGQNFNIPLSYHYTTFLKHQSWPTPRTERRDVDFIGIMGLVPGFTPYRKEDDSAFTEAGPGRRVDVLIEGRASQPRPMKDYLEFLREGGRLRELGDLDGLRHYFDTKRSKDDLKGADLYVSSDEPYFMIYCDRTPDNGLCQVTRVRRDGLYVQYSYSRHYLPQWRAIDQSLTDAISRFRVL